MPRPIVNLADAPVTRSTRHGERFEAHIAPVSTLLGARKLGYNVTVVPPGKRAFPLHAHHANEEMFFVLEGSGVLRYGAEEHPVRPGDVIACVPGGPEHAHQLVNTGSTDLRYLAVSTTIDTDVVQYPDSGKFLAVAGRPPGGGVREAAFGGVWQEDARKDYWDGE